MLAFHVAHLPTARPTPRLRRQRAETRCAVPCHIYPGHTAESNPAQQIELGHGEARSYFGHRLSQSRSDGSYFTTSHAVRHPVAGS